MGVAGVGGATAARHDHDSFTAHITILPGDDLFKQWQERLSGRCVAAARKARRSWLADIPFDFVSLDPENRAFPLLIDKAA
jgi:hypothetical protein